VIAARTGTAAVEVAAATPPDLAILDLQMPEDGVKTYFALLEVAPRLAGRIVILTRRKPPQPQQDFLGMFSGRVLVKPVSPHRVCAALDAVRASAFASGLGPRSVGGVGLGRTGRAATA
jgi:DNA-binding response OmpR family regulator